jgi:hypothetical protein
MRHYLDGPLASEANLPPWHNDEANFASAYARSNLLRREHVERAAGVWHRRFIQTNKERAQALLRQERLALERGTIQRDELQFTFADIWFYNLVLGLSALIAYLIVNDCTAITPQFSAIERRRGNG